MLCAGEKGKRTGLKHSRVMIHQPLGGFRGQASDIAIHAEETLKVKKTLNEILSKHTKQPYDKIVQDTDRDYFLSAQQAVEYGLVDRIFAKRES